MRVLSIPVERLDPASETVVGIGVFDGLHIGHQALLREVATLAANGRRKSVALTFSPHPGHFLRGRRNPQLLEPLAERLNKLSELGIDVAAVVDFNDFFAQLTPARFAEDILKSCLQARQVVVGGDFRFGVRQEGCVDALTREGERNGFKVHITNATKHEDVLVSSTRIRNLLKAGKPFEASRLLGAPYTVRGKVISKPKSTRNLLGFALAQVGDLQSCILPPGVYAASIEVRSLGRFNGIFGVSPKDQQDPFGAPAVVHLYGYHGPKFYATQVCIHVVSQLHEWPSIADPMMWRTLVSADQARTLALNQRSRLLFENSFKTN